MRLTDIIRVKLVLYIITNLKFSGGSWIFSGDEIRKELSGNTSQPTVFFPIFWRAAKWQIGS